MEYKIYTTTTNMYIRTYGDTKKVKKYKKEINDAGFNDFEYTCTSESNFAGSHVAYASALYRIRRIEDAIKKMKDTEYLSLAEKRYIIPNQHRLLNLQYLNSFSDYVDAKTAKVEDLQSYEKEDIMFNFTADYKVIDLVNLIKSAVKLEPTNNQVIDKHYIMSRKKLLTDCAKALVGISEVLRRYPKMTETSLDALRYYVELLLEDIEGDEETVKEIQWMLFKTDKKLNYDIEDLISRKWDLSAKDIATISTKTLPSMIYSYVSLMRDMHLGFDADKALDAASRQMEDEMVKSK